jgi:hypothetical protein
MPTDRLVTQHFPSHQKILFCVLNWGLGHASRSIPIIEALLQKGNEITLASDGMPLALLRHTFPHLPAEELPAYGIRYPRCCRPGLSTLPSAMKTRQCNIYMITTDMTTLFQTTDPDVITLAVIPFLSAINSNPTTPMSL